MKYLFIFYKKIFNIINFLIFILGFLFCSWIYLFPINDVSLKLIIFLL